MKRLLAAIFLAALAPMACAGGSSVSIAVAYDPAVPAMRLRMPADFVALPVKMECDLKDAARRTDAMENALHTLADAIAKAPDLLIRPGVVSLADGRTSYSFTSSKEDYDVSSAQLYILAPLKPGVSLFSATRRIYRTVAAINFGDDMKVNLGDTALAMSDPEQYRPQLLSLLPKAVNEARKALGAPVTFAIDGLQNPVSVMQLNEREVLLFINFQLSVQGKKP
jgi:hypothetical protein